LGSEYARSRAYTSTLAFDEIATLPYAMQLADKGWKKAAQRINVSWFIGLNVINEILSTRQLLKHSICHIVPV